MTVVPTSVVSGPVGPAYGLSMSVLPIVILGPLLALAPPSPDERAVTTWLAQTAASISGAEVVTTADVQQLLDLQGDKQTSGCDDDSEACAAEVASALGAELVVRGELGTLDGARTLTVTVLNTKDLGATRRALWQGETVTVLGEQARAALPDLIAAARTSSGSQTRIFVVDVHDASGGGASAVRAEGTPWQRPVGGVLVGVGVAGLAVGGVAEVMVQSIQGALEKEGADRLDQPAAVEALATRGQWALAGQVGWVVGAVAVVGGGVVLATTLAGE